MHHLGLDYQILDYADPTHESVWKSLTRYGTVPVMRNGDLVVTQSGNMLEYLQDLSGRLLPDDAEVKAKARELLYYADAGVGKASKDVIFEKRDKPEAEWDLDLIKQGTAAWLEVHPYLSGILGDQDYFFGTYSMVDCALTARYALAHAYGLEIPKEFANLQAWYERVVTLPNFRETAPPALLNS